MIGPEEGEWDVVLVAEYPSREAFLEMTSDPGYLEVHASPSRRRWRTRA